MNMYSKYPQYIYCKLWEESAVSEGIEVGTKYPKCQNAVWDKLILLLMECVYFSDFSHYVLYCVSAQCELEASRISRTHLDNQGFGHRWCLIAERPGVAVKCSCKVPLEASSPCFIYLSAKPSGSEYFKHRFPFLKKSAVFVEVTPLKSL